MHKKAQKIMELWSRWLGSLFVNFCAFLWPKKEKALAGFGPTGHSVIHIQSLVTIPFRAPRYTPCDSSPICKRMKASIIVLLLGVSGLFGLTNERISESTDLADSVVIFELEFIDGKRKENIIYSSSRPEEVSSMLVLQKREPKVTVEEKVDEDGNVIGKTTTFTAMSVRCMCVGNPFIEFQKEDKVVLSVSVHHWRSIRETEGYKDNHDLTEEASKRLKDFIDALKQNRQIKAELSTPLAPASLTP